MVSDPPAAPPSRPRALAARVLDRALAVRLSTLALLVMLAAAYAFRMKVVDSWHQPAGDGVQYYTLSQELARAHRFAYGPGGDLTWTRVPGYPLFLAYLAVRRAGIPIAVHLVAATRANVYLDLVTATAIYLLVRRVRPAAAHLAAAGVLLCPALILLSSYALTESLSTCLTTLSVYFCVRAFAARPVLNAAIAGAFIGLGQLVRVDAMLLAPVAGVALLLGVERARRYHAAAALALAALVVFAPWPARNYLRFRGPHPLGATWIAQSGTALPTGALRWMRTWGVDQPAGEYLLYLMANRYILRPDANLTTPPSWDDEFEKRRLVALAGRFNKVRNIDAGINAAFVALAREREQRYPFRTFVTLPLQRVPALWAPLSEADFPMKSRWVHLPEWRPKFKWWDRAMLALALAGAVALFRRGRGTIARRVALMIAGVAVARTVFFCYAHPFPVQRYVVQVFPLLTALAAVGVVAIASGIAGLAISLFRRVLRRRATAMVPTTPT